MIAAPSYKQGFARNATESAAPRHWRGLRLLADPSLGATGKTVHDIARRVRGSVNNATLTTFWSRTSKGLAWDFANGGSSYINWGAPKHLANLGPMTVAFWINARTFGQNSQGRVISKATGIPITGGWSIGTEDVLGNTIVFRRDYSGASDLQRNGVGLVFGTRQRVVVTWNGTALATGVRIYFNGVEASYSFFSNGAGSVVSDTSSELWFGRAQSNSREFDGQLGQVRICSYVWSPRDVRKDYRNWRKILELADAGRGYGGRLIRSQPNMEAMTEQMAGGIAG